jgi:hypothetical protein
MAWFLGSSTTQLVILGCCWVDQSRIDQSIETASIWSSWVIYEEPIATDQAVGVGRLDTRGSYYVHNLGSGMDILTKH